MAKTRIVHDPYRNIDTTLAEFAKAEGVPKYTASHYYWWHKSLDGFRDRPAKGMGNGIKPHTYTYKGAYVAIADAKRITGLNEAVLSRYAKQGIRDIEAITKAYGNHLESRKVYYRADDGRIYTALEYARAKGVTSNTVYQYIMHHGSLAGFDSRGHSRNNPKLYTHRRYKITKSTRGWAEYLGCSKKTVRAWLRNHEYKIDGIENRRKIIHCKLFKYGRRAATLREWSESLGIPLQTVRAYYWRHRTLDGIEERRTRGRPRKDGKARQVK